MQLLASLTDRIVDRLVPKTAARAACPISFACGPCVAPGKQCCHTYADCTKYCWWIGC